MSEKESFFNRIRPHVEFEVLKEVLKYVTFAVGATVIAALSALLHRSDNWQRVFGVIFLLSLGVLTFVGWVVARGEKPGGLVAGVRNDRSGGQGTALSEIPSREDYIRETIEQTRRADRSIWMCVHTLKSAGAGDNVKQLQNALAAKTGIPGGVRLLAPVGEERVLASLQLTKLGVPVRHLAALQNLDVSFSVFDSYRALLPTKSGDAEQTVSGLTVESTKLATILELEFAAFWSRFDVLPHPDFVRYTIGQIMETSPTISLAAVAHRLHVDIGDLRTLLPKFGGPAAHNFFVIGRPCSGKTTAVDALLGTLAQRGIRPEEVYYFNDYEALYERFHEDASEKFFRADVHGGFAVTDFSVLDTVLQEANFRLSTAARFYRVCIVEFARDAYLRPLLNFQSILDRSTIIHLKCSQDTSRSRNQQRRVPGRDHRTGHIPDSILDSFYATDDIQGIGGLSCGEVIEIDTDEVSLERLQNVVEAKLSQVFTDL